MGQEIVVVVRQVGKYRIDHTDDDNIEDSKENMEFGIEAEEGLG